MDFKKQVVKCKMCNEIGIRFNDTEFCIGCVAKMPVVNGEIVLTKLGKEKLAERMEMRSDFEFFVQDRVCCVIDKDTPGFMSVTNDANEVVRHVLKNASEFDRIIYRDSRGVWDELLVQEGRFAGFAAIDEKNLETALKKVAGHDFILMIRNQNGGENPMWSFPNETARSEALAEMLKVDPKLEYAISIGKADAHLKSLKFKGQPDD